MLVDVIDGCDKLVGQLTILLADPRKVGGIPTWSTAS